MPASAALIANLAVTSALVGLIWVVDVAVYPLYARVGAASFVDYHQGWSAGITWVVAPLMFAEVAAAVWLFQSAPRLAAIAAVPIAIAWAVTFFWSVPMHGALEAGFAEAPWRSLMLSNHVRAVAWTARAGLLGWVALRA